jgi:hypothetical protein
MNTGLKTASIISFLVAAFFLMLVPAFSAQQAVVKEMKGKVELKAPGGSWTPATAGATLSRGTVISTGFNSSAVLDLGQSVINVRALTRMTLEELVEEKGTVKTELFLDVGRVRADIKSTEGVAHDFKLKSTVSTASVRGTILEGDGEVWISEDGTFIVTNNSGQKVTVGKGQKTKVTGNAPPEDPKDQLEKDTTVIFYTNPTGGGGAGGGAPPPPPPPTPVLEPEPTTTTVTITWE